jgi:cation diffusion facilitator family transporter
LWGETKLSFFSSKKGAVILALLVVLFLITVKVIVSVITKSISITAQATDSMLDLFAIGVAFLAVRVASEPADEEHPFGHGKMEGVASVVQAGLILAAVVFIVYSAIDRIINGTPLEMTTPGIGVMAVSVVASIFLSRHLQQVAKTTGSTMVDALAKNINADIYSAAGVLVGLIVVQFTKLLVLDSVIALVVSVLILRSAYQVVRRSFTELTDTRLPKEEHDLLLTCINEHLNRFPGFHEVRTRRAGSQRFVDLHLVMRRDVSVEEAHDMCDHLEQDIKDRLPEASVVIHVEPCAEADCPVCMIVSCELREVIDSDVR